MFCCCFTNKVKAVLNAKKVKKLLFKKKNSRKKTLPEKIKKKIRKFFQIKPFNNKLTNFNSNFFLDLWNTVTFWLLLKKKLLKIMIIFCALPSLINKMKIAPLPVMGEYWSLSSRPVIKLSICYSNYHSRARFKTTVVYMIRVISLVLFFRLFIAFRRKKMRFYAGHDVCVCVCLLSCAKIKSIKIQGISIEL